MNDKWQNMPEWLVPIHRCCPFWTLFFIDVGWTPIDHGKYGIWWQCVGSGNVPFLEKLTWRLIWIPGFGEGFPRLSQSASSISSCSPQHLPPRKKIVFQQVPPCVHHFPTISDHFSPFPCHVHLFLAIFHYFPTIFPSHPPPPTTPGHRGHPCGARSHLRQQGGGPGAPADRWGRRRFLNVGWRSRRWNHEEFIGKWYWYFMDFIGSPVVFIWL